VAVIKAFYLKLFLLNIKELRRHWDYLKNKKLIEYNDLQTDTTTLVDDTTILPGTDTSTIDTTVSTTMPPSVSQSDAETSATTLSMVTSSTTQA
jgi:hypothetical protein